MRLFIISRQKTGTHQIMPMFAHVGKGRMNQMVDIVDRSGIGHQGLEAWGFTGERPNPAKAETIGSLEAFSDMAFGHVAYLPEYHAALMKRPTRIIMNLRDPRDTIVAEWEHTLGMIAKGEKRMAWLNYRRVSDGKLLSDLEDPISELIKIDAIIWQNWLGWLDHEEVIPVRYEDLRLHPRTTVAVLRSRLEGISMTSDDVMVAGLAPRRRNPSFRKGLVGEWKEYFKDHHVALAKKLLTPVMDRMGYYW